MKPTRNRVFCLECGRSKMLFETEKKALLFMKYNNEEIAAENDVVPTRAYFCESCGGGHLTPLATVLDIPSKTERVIDRMHAVKEREKAEKLQRKRRLETIKKENEEFFKSQLQLVDEHIANNENDAASCLLDSLLEMSKTKYVKPSLVKRVRQKRELLKGNA